MTHRRLICDFCSVPAVRWSYPAKTFVARDIPMTQSIEDWAACDECHELIEDNDYAALAKRTAATYIDAHEVVSDSEHRKILEIIGGLHQQFRENRTGPAQKEEP